MKKFALATAIAAVISPAVLADTYRADVGIDLAQVSPENGDSSNTTILNGNIYFQDVDTTKGPLAEAAFLDKASSVGLTYSKSSEDGAEALTMLDTRIVFGEKFILEGAYSSQDDSSTIGIGAGLYLSDNVDLVVSYANNDDAELSSLGAAVHGVHAIGGNGASIAYTVNLAQNSSDAIDETGTAFGGDITYYLNNSLGFGAGFINSSFADEDTSSVGLHADWFAMDNLEISAMYSADTTEVGGNSTTDNTISLGAAFRF